MHTQRIHIYILWLLLFFVAYLLIEQINFKPKPGDSRYYAVLTRQLINSPLTSIFAPKWPPSSNWRRGDPSDYVRDHYPGQFLGGALLGKLTSIQDKYAHLVINLVYKVISIYLLVFICAQYFERINFKILYPLMFFSALNINYLIRANQEPSLFLLTITSLYCVEKYFKNPKWFFGLFMSIGYSFLIKGIGSFFVPMYCFIYYFALNPNRNFKNRNTLLFLASFLSIPIFIITYEFYFKSLTGYPIFTRHISVQLLDRGLSKEKFDLLKFIFRTISNFSYYSIRHVVNSMPWSLIAVFVVLKTIITKSQQFNFSQLKLPITIFFTSLLHISIMSFFSRISSRYLYASMELFNAACVLVIIIYSKKISNFFCKYLKHGEYIFMATWLLFICLYALNYTLKAFT
ncbi:MAG: hypothetical protein ISR65_04485 [Bacteriovoracaceae bacterium]|nr:hypothetical protein [Bacteriovoracaceae bacterium]